MGLYYQTYQRYPRENHNSFKHRVMQEVQRNGMKVQYKSIGTSRITIGFEPRQAGTKTIYKLRRQR